MVIFVDTSSLAKRYVEEPGSEKVDTFFLESNTIILAPTTPIEIRSVLSRRLREKSLSPEVVELALSEWMKEERSYQLVPFTDQMRADAIEVIERTGVKTLDSIQLAAARLSNAGWFVTSDKALAVAARSIFQGQVEFID